MASNSHRVGRNRLGHRLRRLKRRLSKQALARREQKMLRGGTWRLEMVKNLNQTFAGVGKVVNGNQAVNDNRAKTFTIWLGVLTLMVLGILARLILAR